MYAQQDCHEFLQILAEKIQESTQKSVTDVGLNCIKLPLEKRNLHKFPLQGYLSSRLYCRNCKATKPANIEPFYVLTLCFIDKESGDEALDLGQLFSKFTSKELIDDAECEQCKRKNCVSKQTMLLSVCLVDEIALACLKPHFSESRNTLHSNHPLTLDGSSCEAE